MCYSDIRKVHSMCPIRRSKWHALLTTVIFMHQVSDIGFITRACIVFQKLKLQSLYAVYARDKSIGSGKKAKRGVKKGNTALVSSDKTPFTYTSAFKHGLDNNLAIDWVWAHSFRITLHSEMKTRLKGSWTIFSKTAENHLSHQLMKRFQQCHMRR